MIINLKFGEFEKKSDENEKVIDIELDKVIRNVTHFGVLSFIGREVNRVRPPKRNIGLVFNWMTALCVTDAIMELVFPKKVATEKESVVDCEEFSEVKADAAEAESEEKTDI